MSWFDRILRRWQNRDYTDGMLHFNRGEYPEAVAAFERYLKGVRDGSNPDVELARFYAAEAHAKLGVSLFHQGEAAQSEEELLQAVAVETSYPDLFYYLGVLAERRGDTQVALDRLDQALNLNPNYAQALAYRVLVRCMTGASDTARDDLRKLSDLGYPLPNSLNTPESEISREALDDLRRSIQERVDGSRMLADALESYRGGDLKHAARELEKAIAAHPDYPDLRARYGQIRLEMGDLEGALDAFDVALRLNPDYVEALVAQGGLLLRTRRPNEAVSSLHRAFHLRPEHGDAAYLLGQALLDAGRPGEALEPLSQSVGLNPEHAGARFALGQALYLMGERDRGLFQLQQSAEAPDTPDSRLRFLASVLVDAQQYEKAARLFERLYREEDEDADLALGFGIALLGMKQMEAAQAMLGTVLRWEPLCARAHYYLGKLHVLCERPHEALRHLQAAVSTEPQVASLQTLLAEIHLNLGDEDAAGVAFEKGLTVDPGSVDAMTGLALLRRRQGRHPEAEALFARILQLTPHHPTALQQRGAIDRAA